MQIKKSSTLFFALIIIIWFLFNNYVFASLNYENPLLKQRVERFIQKADRYRIFHIHMKLYSILEKLDKNDFEKNRNKQILYIDSILRENIRNYIETNYHNKIKEKLSKVIQNKWEILKDFEISKINLVENKSYIPIWRVFYKTRIEYKNNWKTEIEYLNIYYNWDIGVYYRPQENSFNPNFENRNINIQLADKRISGILSYNKNIQPQNLIILTTGWWENDRDFLSSKHRINIVLSNYFNNLWYATFRYDKSSIGWSTWTNFMDLTTQDLAWDLGWILNFFKTQSQISIDKIWLFWHSEWAVISSIVTSDRNDISFLILSSTPYSSLENIIKDGSINYWIKIVSDSIKTKINSSINEIIRIIQLSSSKEETKKLIWEYKNSLSLEDKIIFNSIEKNIPFGDTNDLSSPWFQYYLQLDIRDYLNKINIPILVINWNKDFIIDDSRMWEINNIIETNNKNSELKIIPNSWHMMEYNSTRTDNDYSTKSESINIEVLKNIELWLKGMDNN